MSTQGPERSFFLPDFFNPVKNGTGVQNQDKQSATAVALNLTSIERALGQEYRFTYRAAEHADFLEGIRAAIIDKDRSPIWRHGSVENLGPSEVHRMLMPLGADALKL